MSRLLQAAGEAARQLVNKRDPFGSVPLDHGFIRTLLIEAFMQGALYGVERGQHALAITHARLRTDLDDTETSHDLRD